MKKISKSKRKPLLLASLVLLLLIAGYLAYKALSSPEGNSSDTQTITTQGESYTLAPATDVEKKEAEDKKQEQFGPGSSSGQVASSPPTETSAKIRNVYQDQSTKNVVVQTELSGSGWKKCTLILTKGTQKVTETAETIYQPSYSSCLGFSTKVPDSGLWYVNLSVSRNDGSTVYAAEKSLSVN